MSATEMWQKSGSRMWTIRLKVYKAINGMVIVGLGCILAGLSNENWAQMDGQARFLFEIGIALSVLKSLDMYLDQGSSELQKALKTLQDSHDSLKAQIASLQPPLEPAQVQQITSMKDLQKPTTPPQFNDKQV